MQLCQNTTRDIKSQDSKDCNQICNRSVDLSRKSSLKKHSCSFHAIHCAICIWLFEKAPDNGEGLRKDRRLRGLLIRVPPLTSDPSPLLSFRA